MTTCCPGSRHRAGFVWSAPGHARFSPPASRSAQRSPSVNFTGNRTPCRKNRRPRRHWQRVQHLAHPGRGGRLSDSSSADHPTADQRRLPSRARRRSLRGSSAADVQNRSARAIPAFITFDFQRSEVASRPGKRPVRPVAIADIDHGACVPCRDLLYGGAGPTSQNSLGVESIDRLFRFDEPTRVRRSSTTRTFEWT